MANLDNYHLIKEQNTIIRIGWSLLNTTLVIVTVALVTTLGLEFLTNPTITTLETTHHPVDKIPFPGVAICNTNKISKKSALDFAEFVSSNTKLSVQEIYNATHIFGKLYDFEYDKSEEVTIRKLQKVVEDLELNLVSVMQKFTTTCDVLLKRCRWKGVRVNCSEIFNMRTTYDGFCCTFNYIKKPTRFNTSVPKEPFLGEPGVGKGLSVLVENNIDDFLYAPSLSEGVMVLVFIPSDYPDKSSGSLNEVFAKVDTENFVEVVPTTIHSVREIINYPLSQRRCLFDEERITTFHGTYSQSDCNVDCRITTTLALCDCIPFTIPYSTKDSVCNLNNLACLSRYRNKFLSFYPENDDLKLLQREKHDSLRCNQKCYPSCDGTTYAVTSNVAPIHFSKRGNHTVIHVYYGSRFSELYKQDVVYYWFEILSNFGGTFGLVLGVSVISMIDYLILTVQTLRIKCSNLCCGGNK